MARLLTLPVIGRLIRKLSPKYIVSRGVKIETREEHIPDSMIAALYWGMYESSEMRLIKKHLRKDLPVIELGGSIGVVTSLCGQITRERILSIEANPAIHIIQQHILEMNGIGNASIIHCGIGYSENPLYFIPGDTNITGRLSGTKYPGSVNVPIKPLSGIISENQLGEFILICDIEGIEHDLIRLDGSALEHCKQLFIEYHELDIRNVKRELTDFLEILGNLGFKIRDRDGLVFCLDK